MTKQAMTRLPEEARVLTPRADIYENDAEYLVIADLPGVTREQVSVELADGRLVIETPDVENRWYRRAFTVPQGLRGDAITAQLDQGVLSVHLPKPVEQRPVRIEVH